MKILLTPITENQGYYTHFKFYKLSVKNSTFHEPCKKKKKNSRGLIGPFDLYAKHKYHLRIRLRSQMFRVLAYVEYVVDFISSTICEFIVEERDSCLNCTLHPEQTDFHYDI